MISIRNGQRISRITVRETLSRGGFAIIVRCTTPEGQEIVLKIARPDKVGDPFFAIKLENEVRVLQKLSGIPGIVQILQQSWERKPNIYIAVAIELPNEPKYYAMELLRGPSLEKYAKSVKKIHSTAAAAIGRETAIILHEIHRKGVIHHDIKLDNIVFRHPLIRGNPYTPVLIDFGISEAATKKTFDGMAAPYTAPEKLEVVIGEKPPEHLVDLTKADIWGLGVVLYQIISGKLPFDGRDAKGVLTSIRRDRIERLRDRQRDVPRDVDDVILRDCLADKPQDRPTALELAHALEPFMENRVQ